MPPWLGIELALLLIGAAALAFYVVRRQSTLVVDKVFEASPEDVWRLSYFAPGMPIWLEMLERIDWDEGSGTDGLVMYKIGMMARLRQQIDHQAMRVAVHMDVLNKQGQPSERLISLISVTPHPDGARYLCESTVERIGSLSLLSWFARITRPLAASQITMLLRQELERNGAFARYAEQHGERPAPASVLGMRLSWGALALAAIALGYWGWSFGLWFTVALAAGLVLHEAGHVAVMRRLGDKTSAFYFVPFLGGVAIGRKQHAHDGTVVAMVFGGPLAGLASALAAMALGYLFDNDFLLACGYFFALFNLFNLAPIPPLDGGQITVLALRPFLPEAVLHWLSTGLLGVGAMAALWLEAPILTAIFVLLGVFAVAVPRQPITRPPLTRGVAALSLAGLLLLAGALYGVMAVIGDDLTFRMAARALIRGPFAD
jgi:Zn-dependent protease